MSPHYYRRRRRLMAEMNVVPYIDVMLVLLVIFMITSPMLSLTQGVEVDLPEVASESVAQEQAGPVIVTLNTAGEYFLTYDAVEEQQLTVDVLLPRIAALLRQAPRRSVLVRADTAVAHGEVVKLMALLQRGGVKKVGIMTKPPSTAIPASKAGSDNEKP